MTRFRTTGIAAMLGKARVGIQPKVGPGELWPSILFYIGVMNQLEFNYGPTGATDIENDGFWCHAIETGALEAIPVDTPELTASPGGTGGGVIIFTGIPGYLYRIRSSVILRDWQDFQEISTMAIYNNMEFHIPVRTAGPRGFFTAERRSP